MKPHLPVRLRRALLIALTILPTLGSGTLGLMTVGTLLSSPAALAAETNAGNVDTTELVTLTEDTDYRFNHNQSGHSHLYNGGLDIGSTRLSLYTTFNHASHVMVNGLSGTDSASIYLYRGVDANNQGYTDSFMLLYLKGQGSYSGSIIVGSQPDGTVPASTGPTMLLLGSNSVGQNAKLELRSGSTDNIIALSGDLSIGSLTAEKGQIRSIDATDFTDDALKIVSSDATGNIATLVLGNLKNTSTPYKLTLTADSSLKNTVIDVTLAVSSGTTLTLSGAVDLNNPIENSGTILLADDFDFSNLTYAGTGNNYYLTTAGSVGSVTGLKEGYSYDAATGLLSITSGLSIIREGQSLSIAEIAEEQGETNFATMSVIVEGGTLSIGTGKGSLIAGSTGNYANLQLGNDQVSFRSGTLHLSGGATVSTPPVLEEGAEIALLVSGTGNTWTKDATITSTKGVSSITLEEGAELTVEDVPKADGTGTNQYSPFYASAGTDISITVGKNATLNSGNLWGWVKDAPAATQHPITIEEGGTWHITGLNENKLFLNQTGIRLQGGTIRIDDGASVNSERANNSIETLAEATQSSLITGGSINLNNRPLTITTNRWQGNDGSQTDLLIESTITGSQTITKDGDGTLSLSGANTNTGTVNINAGTLLAASESALGTGAVNIASGAVLGIASNLTLTGAVDLKDGAGLSWLEESVLTLNGNVTIGGKLSLDLSNLTTEGTATLITFNGQYSGLDLGNIDVTYADGYTGSFSLNGNSVQLTLQSTGLLFWLGDGSGLGTWTDGDSSNFADSSTGTPGSATFTNGSNIAFVQGSTPAVTLEGNLSVGHLILQKNAQVSLSVDSGNTAGLKAGSISLADGSTLSKTGEGRLNLSSEFLAIPLNLLEGTLGISDTLSGNIDISQLSAAAGSTLALNCTAASGNTLLLNDAQFNGALSLESGRLSTAHRDARDYSIASGAELTLSNFDPTAVSAISGQGTLALTLDQSDGSNALSFSSDWSGNVRLSGTTAGITLSGDGKTFGSAASTLEINGLSGSIATDARIDQDLILSNPGTDTPAWQISSPEQDSTLTLSGALSGSGELRADASGTGALTLNLAGDTGSYVGTIVVIIGSRPSALNLSGSGDIAAAISAQTSEGTTAAAPLSVSINAESNRNLLGSLSGNATLEKHGSGTLTIGRANTYSGGTRLSAGTLCVTNAQALGSGDLIVSSGATLSIDGTLAIGGDLSMESGSTLTVNRRNALTIGGDTTLAGITLDVTDLALLDGRSLTLATAAGDSKEQNLSGITIIGAEGATLSWEGDNLVITSGSAGGSHLYAAAATSPHAVVGGIIADAVYDQLHPQGSATDSPLAVLLDALDADLGSNNRSALDAKLRTLSGATAAGLGLAYSDDMQRQLRSIRNRMTSMGVSDAYVNPDMPYFNAWVNAEGNHRELDNGGSRPGYTLSSWGGTVGFDADLNTALTCGLAFTAMYGDYSSDADGGADGELDTRYLSAFARYSPGAWTHSFIVSVGLADSSLKRNNVLNGTNYRTDGSANGLGLGLMYEVGYTIPLDENADSCLQPVLNISYAYTEIDGYTEHGNDLALRFGDQKLHRFTLGAGLRAQTLIGENIYNRSSLLEGRILAKFDLGDRRSSMSSSLALLPGYGGTVASEELGVCGVEAGVGLSIPLGRSGGNLFLDGSVELRSDYCDFNGTVGWRINF